MSIDKEEVRHSGLESESDMDKSWADWDVMR
jgi:hypothetical protein